MTDHVDHPITSDDEARERQLNRHRTSERRAARVQIVARLAERGVPVGDTEPEQAVVETLEAVEAFERAVQARGGDLMVDTLPAFQPEDPRLVLPKRGPGEPLADYANRVWRAARQLSVRRAD